MNVQAMSEMLATELGAPWRVDTGAMSKPGQERSIWLSAAVNGEQTVHVAVVFAAFSQVRHAACFGVSARAKRVRVVRGIVRGLKMRIEKLEDQERFR